MNSRTNNSSHYLLYGLLLTITLAIGYWFYTNFAWVTEEKEVGFQGIAKTNKLLAAEFFLRKMGVQAQQVNGLIAFRQLPSTGHTLLVATQRETLTKELSQALMGWVKAGGHLIVEARYRSDTKKNRQTEQANETDVLLEDLSVYATRNESDDDNEQIPVSFFLPDDLSQRSQENDLLVDFATYRSLSWFNDDTKPESTHLIAQPIWSIEDDSGTYLMQFALEQGLLTVLNSTSIFNNDQIEQFDHARFLLYLTQQHNHNAGVWLIRTDDMPALWTWLWDNGWYAMSCLSLIFLFWLWRAPLRFGPVLNDTGSERRSLMEHIRASGYYRWHENQSGVLLARVQETLWEKIQQAHPVARRENPAQAFAMLADITGIKESLIQLALTPVKDISEDEFTRRVRILESIRKHL